MILINAYSRLRAETITPEQENDLIEQLKSDLTKAGYKTPQQFFIEKGNNPQYPYYVIRLKDFAIKEEDVEKLLKTFNNIEYDKAKDKFFLAGEIDISVLDDYKTLNKVLREWQGTITKLKKFLRSRKVRGNPIKIKNIEIWIPKTGGDDEVYVSKNYRSAYCESIITLVKTLIRLNITRNDILQTIDELKNK